VSLWAAQAQGCGNRGIRSVGGDLMGVDRIVIEMNSVILREEWSEMKVSRWVGE
jgi:hypothetical protein